MDKPVWVVSGNVFDILKAESKWRVIGVYASKDLALDAIHQTRAEADFVVTECPYVIWADAGRQDDAAMQNALRFLNLHFSPWIYAGREPVAEALAALLRGTDADR